MSEMEFLTVEEFLKKVEKFKKGCKASSIETVIFGDAVVGCSTDEELARFGDDIKALKSEKNDLKVKELFLHMLEVCALNSEWRKLVVSLDALAEKHSITAIMGCIFYEEVSQLGRTLKNSEGKPEYSRMHELIEGLCGGTDLYGF